MSGSQGPRQKKRIRQSHFKINFYDAIQFIYIYRARIKKETSKRHAIPTDVQTVHHHHNSPWNGESFECYKTEIAANWYTNKLRGLMMRHTILLKQNITAQTLNSGSYSNDMKWNLINSN